MKTNRNQPEAFNRRKFLKGVTLTLGTTILGLPLLSMSQKSAESSVAAENESEQTGAQKRKLGIALVGLGQYSANQLAPALQETENCYLAGIVTGTPSKAQAWKTKYNIPAKNIYNYENFDEIAQNKDIDIVYVVLPNAMHAEYTIRAAKAKKHVICEKPMATTVADAQRMLDACRQNNVQLAIGYRLHFEPFHRRVMELGQKQVYGKVQQIEARNSGDQTNGSLDIWRLNKKLAGGGPLMDLGIYCVQGAIYTMGTTPVAVTAKFGEVTKPSYFYDVEQSISWQMEFENGVVATCNSSYADDENVLSSKAEKGWWKLSPSYAYEGKKGETSEGPMNLPNIYEQVKQMDSQAESFRRNKPSIVPGEMGLRDMKILMAIYESAKAGGKRVPIN
ncbi:Gfo/Idh/MocA family oxidoreductase [uncultured Pontibacter sp.]|uniref:Gfo/Idh/MocA family protein n=1 Tax=uncultured Pontibacter sp. TaxID=453356 RepID=UPI00262D0403|nr:Gfo/Idh/MocA family oxidoreductase [uncultured Pontibacter sp.]